VHHPGPADVTASRSRKNASFRRRLAWAHAWLYRLTGGRLLGRMGGQPVLLLTTTGRRTGTARTTPVQYSADDRTLVVVAANGGSHTAPQWYLNLLASPEVRVERAGETMTLRAREATGSEREQLWRTLTAGNRWLAAAEQRAGRRFPVVVLDP
jgi:deazaflavin-dependent oxidoreductase (nitroreductase family)